MCVSVCVCCYVMCFLLLFSTTISNPFFQMVPLRSFSPGYPAAPRKNQRRPSNSHRPAQLLRNRRQTEPKTPKNKNTRTTKKLNNAGRISPQLALTMPSTPSASTLTRHTSLNLDLDPLATTPPAISPLDNPFYQPYVMADKLMRLHGLQPAPPPAPACELM